MALSKNILATPSKRLWPIQSSLVGSNRTSRCYQSTISKVFISVRDQCLHFITIKWHQFCSQEHEQKSRIRPSPAQMGRLTDIGSRNIFTEEQVSKGRTHKKMLFFWILSKLPYPPPFPLHPLPPIWTTCKTFFRRQNSRFESQVRTKNTIFTI